MRRAGPSIRQAPGCVRRAHRRIMGRIGWCDRRTGRARGREGRARGRVRRSPRISRARRGIRRSGRSGRSGRSDRWARWARSDRWASLRISQIDTTVLDSHLCMGACACARLRVRVRVRLRQDACVCVGTLFRCFPYAVPFFDVFTMLR
jgi:hypothetical protein